MSPILERVGDLTAPVVARIKDAIRRKLDEAQEIARGLGEGAGNVIDDVTGRTPQVATEGAGNEPSRMESSSSSGGGSSPIPSPPSGMSDKLIDIRSTFKDPRAVEAFDNKFAKMRGNSKAMEGAISGMRRSGSDIEVRMLDEWKQANPTPKGAGLSRVPDALARGQKLRDEIQAFKDANPNIKGINKWFSRIKGEIKNLNKMSQGKMEAKPEIINSALDNFKGVEAEFRYAQKQPGVIEVNAELKYIDEVGDTRITDVDVVADNGKTWIDNKSVKPFGLESSNWKGHGDKQGLKKQAEKLLKTAQQNPVEGVPPKVVIEFPEGVTREVAQELQKMGVEVRGTIVDI